MPRRLVLLSAAVACAALQLGLLVESVEAGAGSSADSGGCSGGGDGPTIQVGCDAAPPPPPPPPNRPSGITNPTRPCVSTPAAAVDGWDPEGYDSATFANSGFTLFRYPDGTVGRSFGDGREQRAFTRRCPDGPAINNGAYWVDVGITIDDVIDDATDRARRQIPVPTLDISPPPQAGGVVNLGLWLAIAPVPPITVRAEAGGLWAEVTANLARTTWDMGNGDTVTCEGPGEPITDIDDPGQGPCGYTYRRSSPDDAPYQLGLSATWTISYRSSAGGGTRPPLDRTVTVDYDVDEIQTIGISN